MHFQLLNRVSGRLVDIGGFGTYTVRSERVKMDGKYWKDHDHEPWKFRKVYI